MLSHQTVARQLLVSGQGLAQGTGQAQGMASALRGARSAAGPQPRSRRGALVAGRRQRRSIAASASASQQASATLPLDYYK